MNRATFVVEFDSEVWASMTDEERQQWRDEVEDAINDLAHVVEVSA